MSIETKEQLREKIEQSRRLLRGMSDPATADSLRIYIEQLEARLLRAMNGTLD